MLLIVESLLLISGNIDNKSSKIDNVLNTYGYSFEEGYEEMLRGIVVDLLEEIEKVKEIVDNPCKRKVRTKVSDQLLSIIKIVQSEEKVILDILASYILFQNFSRDREVVYDLFQPFTEVHRYGTIVDTLDTAGLKLRDKHSMVELAKAILIRI